jgi:hypothetical protein
MRKWTLRRIDAQQEACRVGDNTAVRRLRAMHWGSTLANVVLLASVVSSCGTFSSRRATGHKGGFHEEAQSAQRPHLSRRNGGRMLACLE